MRWLILGTLLVWGCLSLPARAEVVHCPDGSIYAGDRPESACGADSARVTKAAAGTSDVAAPRATPPPATVATAPAPATVATAQPPPIPSIDPLFVDDGAQERCAARFGGSPKALELCAAREAHAVLRLNQLIDEAEQNDQVGNLFLDCTQRYTHDGIRLWGEILSCVESGKKELTSRGLTPLE